MQTEQKMKCNIEIYSGKTREELIRLEEKWRNRKFLEFIPPAQNTPFTEVAEAAIPDKAGRYRSTFYYFITSHPTSTPMREMGRKAETWFIGEAKEKNFDILSLSTGIEDGKLKVKTLIRAYGGKDRIPDMPGFYELIGEEYYYLPIEDQAVSGRLVVPDEIKNFGYSEKEKQNHEEKKKAQEKAFLECSFEKPFLNRIERYEPLKLPNPADKIDMIYDLETKDKTVKTLTPYKNFNDVFKEILIMVNGTDYHNFVNVLKGDETQESYMAFLEKEITDKYINDNFNGFHMEAEDLPYMMEKLYNALFKLYVVQPLIDDPEVTDVKITAPDSIRARIKGKAYMSNITFIDRNDYLRFVNTICIRDRVLQNVPAQTFTDRNDENYVLRMSLTSEFVNAVEWPYLHIRKVDRDKMLSDDLIKAGMMDEKIRDYLLDCGKNSRGVVFAGPPGSGKTVILNWFLEDAYEQSAEILVIQENDELFCYRKGVMFEHVVNYATKTKPTVSLEQLGQLALVAGANVFVIGEAKGAEICSAITLSNSGCRTALTIHSPSSTETVDKMADLAMRGYAADYKQAKRMLKSFQTIVYLENFKVQEISEITGFDEEKGDMEYRYIYRRIADGE